MALAADDVVTVIGVVSDVRRRDLASDVEPELYMAHGQTTWDGSMAFREQVKGLTREGQNEASGKVRLYNGKNYVVIAAK